MTVVDERAVAADEVEEPVATTATMEPMEAAGLAPVVDRESIARLVGDARAAGTPIDGEGGLLAQLTKLVVESALEGEMTAHLGYEKHERAGEAGAGNARNGSRSKTVLTKAGPIRTDVPRDRAGTFQPAVVGKRQRRLGSA